MNKTVVTGLVLLAALTLGLAGKEAAGCNDLRTKSIGSKLVRGSIHCTHGKVKEVKSAYEIVLTNIGLYGAGCQITFECTYGIRGYPYRRHVKSTYRYQQNYCSTHSSRITVQHIKGPKIPYQLTEGSWSSEKSGRGIMDPR